MKCDIRLLYFIIFNNFIERKSINQAYYNYREFSKQLKIETISKKANSKFMNIIRLKIMHSFHNKWNHNLLGTELADNGKPRIELDESKIVTFDNQVRWMLGFVDRDTKEVRVYYINNDCTKEKFLPILKKNVYSDRNNPAT